MGRPAPERIVGGTERLGAVLGGVARGDLRAEIECSRVPADRLELLDDRVSSEAEVVKVGRSTRQDVDRRHDPAIGEGGSQRDTAAFARAQPQPRAAGSRRRR